MRTHRWIGLLAALLALPLAAACDDGDEDTDAGVDAAMPDDDAGTPEDDAGMEEDNSIAGIAARNPDFSMLVAAADKAGLITLLSGSDEFTVFAPTNAAFEDSGITMEMIEAMSADDVRGILTYHALEGTVRSTDITAGPATTAAGLSIILGTEGGVTVNGGNAVVGGANVTEADIEADNGVIHVIDRVLLPPTVADLARYAGLTELVTALSDTGLDTTLAEADEVTVFAPTDDAFPDDTTGLDVEQILLYHVVGSRVPSTAIPDSADTLSTVSFEDGDTREYALDVFFDTTSGVAINGDAATVVTADVVGTNGIVHVIDGVLLPLSIAEVADVAGFTQLLTAVGASDPIPASIAGSETPVADALSTDGLAPLTVFAPTDDAFAAVPGGLPTDGGDILGVLGLHVIAQTLPVRAEDLPGDTSTTVPSLIGTDLFFDTSMTPPTVNVTGGNAAGIVGTDVGATNGVVHVIDTVLLETP
jgi:transforming growth factor-beta-induced protein